MRPIRDGRADDDVFLSGVAVKENLEAGEHGHEKRRAFALAEGQDGVGERFRQRQPFARAAEGLHGGARAIGWQFQSRQFTTELFFPVIDLRFEDVAL